MGKHGFTIFADATPIQRYQSTALHDQWPKGYDSRYILYTVNILLGTLTDSYELAHCPQSLTNYYV